MSHTSKLFNSVPIQIKNKSGFDMSHENLFTAKVGTLVPVLTEPLIPNTTVTLGSMLNVQLPPMATDFFGRVDAKLEVFFCPSRLCWGGFQKFITQDKSSPVSSAYPSGSSTYSKPFYYPSGSVSPTNGGPGTLADYLGVKGFANGDSRNIPNILPFVAYHRIWDDWYRDSNIQNPAFSEATTVDPSNIKISNLPYTIRCDSNGKTNISSYVLGDSVSLYSLRQRNFAKDYFTSATLNPQAGSNPATLTFDVSDTGASSATHKVGEGSFTIAGLRAVNALQTWLERNNLVGTRYYDQIRAQYGITPSDAVMDRPVYLGSQTINVYNKSVYQSALASDDYVGSKNPFTSVGSKFGSSSAFGDGSLIDSFTTTEHGYLMVLFSLVPHAYYSTGTRRYLYESTVGDVPFPLLEGVGDQPIYRKELSNISGPSSEGTFGYTLRNAHYKYHDDEVHGLLGDGQSLSSFCIKRGFSGTPVLSSEFLQIPTNFLDDVSAVNDSISNFGCWGDIYFSFKISAPLGAYVIPTLGDMKDTHTEVVEKGGKRL